MAWLVFFRKAKGQREIKSTLALFASHEACCRMAVYTGQLMGNHTRPASREARCRVAVERSQAARLPIPLRAIGAQSGVQGLSPCLFADAEAGEDVVEKLLVYAVAGDAAQKIKGFVQVDGGKVEGCAGGKAGLSLTETVRRLPGQSHVPLLHQLPLVGLA